MRSRVRKKFFTRSTVLISILLFVVSFLLLIVGVVLQKGYTTARDPYVCDITFTQKNCLFTPNKTVKQKANVLLSADTVNGNQTYEGFVMQNGASIRLDTVTGIRFKAHVPETLVEKVKSSENEHFKFVIAPAYYFEKAIQLNGGEDGINYVEALAQLEREYGAKPALKMVCEPVWQNGGYIVQGSVVEILYANTNLEFAAVAYVETTTDESVTYTYAAFPKNCLSSARSVSYVATAALNDTNISYSEEALLLLKNFIAKSADCAAGLSEQESEAVTQRNIRLSLSAAPDRKLAIGETFSASASIVVEYPDLETVYNLSAFIPLYWKSANPSVFLVDSEGVITSLSEGRASLLVCFGETVEAQEIVCGSITRYTCEIRDCSEYQGLLDISVKKAEIAEGGIFETTVSVRNYAEYGELSFWIDGRVRTTEDGSYTLTEPVTEDKIFEITRLSSGLDYFTIEATRLSIKNKTGFSILPEKMILPEFSDKGSALTTISGNLYSVGGTCKDLRELVVPQSYISIMNNTLFQNCSNLETIYLYNSKLSTISKAAIWTNCNALKNIYVPAEALSAYQKSTFWKAKLDCLKPLP